MKDILRMILKEKNFSTKDQPFGFEESIYADRTDDYGFDFLTVLFLDKENFSKTNLNQYIEKLFKEFSQQDNPKMGWDKNLSLLIMLKVDSIDISSEIQSLIFDIEEDPFMFKKYILPYTGKQEDVFTEQLEHCDENEILNFLNLVLYDAEKFSTFKTKRDCEEYLLYDLVSKLFIKIPYLNIINQNKEIDSLMTEIDESLTVEEKEVLIKLLDLKEPEGDEIDTQKLLESIGATENE